MLFHNAYHLGDCLYHLHYLMRLWRLSGRASTFFCAASYHAELSAFLPDGFDIRLEPLEARPAESVDCWIGANDFHIRHPNWHDYHAFYVDFFKSLSAVAGVHCPIQRPADMLFDSPAIPARGVPSVEYDWLIVNAKPLSGQWDTDGDDWIGLVTMLLNAGQRVITTHPCGIHRVPATINLRWRVADIAKLSMGVRNLVAIDTGPTGSTFNIWNQGINRFILHRTNYFTHEGCRAVHKWADLLPAIRGSGALGRGKN